MSKDLISAGGCALKPVLPQDTAAFRQVMSGSEMGRHTDVPAQPTSKKATAFVDWMVKLNAGGRGKAWSIHAHDQIVGFIRINKIEKKTKIGVIGYEVGQEFWGQGLATCALRGLVVYAHDVLKLRRLEAWVLNGNAASAGVLTNAGFQHEGTQRRKMQLHGEYRDVMLFGRLSEDAQNWLGDQ